MRVVIQRVNHANVVISGTIHSRIDNGLCVFLGIEVGADKDDLVWLVNKIVNLRIFSDDQGKMNLSLLDVEGELLLISQFTLHASTRKGNRPSFVQAEKPEIAEQIYTQCISLFKEKMGNRIKSGVFGGDMKIGMENNGPVTIIIDTELKW